MLSNAVEERTGAKGVRQHEEEDQDIHRGGVRKLRGCLGDMSYPENL